MALTNRLLLSDPKNKVATLNVTLVACVDLKNMASTPHTTLVAYMKGELAMLQPGVGTP